MFEWFNMWTFGNVSLCDFIPPVKLSDDSAETKKPNNFEGAEQGSDAVVIVVKGVEDIVREAGEKVDQEPGLWMSNIKHQLYQLYAEPDTHLEIIDADDFRVADHLAPRTHVGRVKVQDDVDEKYYWKYIWWKILLKYVRCKILLIMFLMKNITETVCM